MRREICRCKLRKMIWISLLITGCLADSSNVLVKKFDGHLASSGYLDKVTVRSRLECARKCAQRDECSSLFYVADSRECQTHAEKYGQGDVGLIVTTSALYYEKEGDVSTSTTPIPFSCPPNDSQFYPVTLSDGKQFSYRMFMDVSRSFTEAVSKCEEVGSTLYEATPLLKFTFTQQLMDCSAYSDKNFWVNGKVNAGTWETLTGNAIPMTSDFWYTGRPNDNGATTCMWMQSDKGHYFDDFLCDPSTVGYPYPVYTICEIQD